MRKLRGLITFGGALVLIMLGIGMWQGLEINWEGFLAAWSAMANEIARLITDPFAALGVVVVIIGVLITLRGLWRVVRG